MHNHHRWAGPIRRGRAARRGRTLPATLSVALVLASLTALVLSSGTGGPAATLPAGFQESIGRLSGLTNPTVVRFAPDGRVFVAEKRGVIKVFDSLTDTTPHVFADLRTQRLQLLGPRACSAWRSHPNFPTRPLRLCALHLRPRAGSAAPAPRWGTPGVYSDPCPTPPGPTGDGCVVSGRLSRLQAAGNAMSGAGAGADRGLVPAVPQPLDRGGGVRARRGAVRQRRRRGQLQLRRLRPGRQPRSTPAATRRAGSGPRSTRPPPRAAPCAARTCAPAATRSPWTAAVIRVDPATGAALPEQPARRQPRPQRPADHRLRAAQPLPLHLPPGHQRALDRRRRLERLGGDQPHPQPDRRGRGELRLALLRGQRAASRATTAPTSASARTCTASRARCTAPYYAYHHSNRVVAGRDLPDRQLLDRRAAVRVLPRQHLSGRVRRRAVLRRLLPRLHLGDAQGRRRPSRPRARSGRSWPARPTRSTWRWAGRRPLLRRLRRRHDPAHPSTSASQPAADRGRHGHPDHRRCAAHGQLRRHAAPATPTGRHPHLRLGPRRRRRLRRLHRRPSRPTPTPPRDLCRPLQGDRQPRRRPTPPRCTITVGNTPAHGDHRHAGRRHHLEGRRRHQLLRLGDRPAGRHPPGIGALPGS